MYDGSSEYKIEDNSTSFVSKISKKPENNFSVQLDSAQYYKKRDPFKSIEFIEEALKSQASKRENSLNISKAYEVLGDVYMNLKQYDLASKNYKTALNSKTATTIKLKLAKSLSLENKSNESIIILNSIVTSKMTALQKIEVYETLGDNFLKLNNNQNAESNYNLALSFANANKFNEKVIALTSKLAKVSNLQGRVTEAENYLDSTIAVSKKTTLNKRAFITNSVANQYRSQNNFDKEIELKKQTLQELEEANLNEVIVESDDEEKISVQQLNLDIGNAYAKKKSFTEAIDYLEKSKNDAGKAADIETKKEAVEQLSEIYKNVGDYEKALSNYQKYVSLVDILYKQKENEIDEIVDLNKDLCRKAK